MTRIMMIIGAVIVALSLSASINEAATPTGSTGGANASGLSTIYRYSHFIIKIENNILYLEDKKSYNLAGVRVTDLTGRGQAARTKKLAELIFVNGVLREVNIR